ncbi:MAG: threonylcarbamoyl-AMP synthase [Muribaculaceae bacterium]|nr:threonylcarbamoyl-AMP synthase [Muribaculaceae bacterium]MDE7081485.1 threonylcarbamoyl-AMP synthase [Muribaculaceae bacterium]
MDQEDFKADLQEALATLRKGGVILYPTDTIWGIGADATNPEAVARIYALKRRADSKSMLALVDSADSLYRWLENVPETALQLIDVAVDPLTIIYDSPRGIAPNMLAPDGSLGIRITSERFSRELCRRLGRPLVSTSANISGHPSAPFFGMIEPEILEGVDYVARYRRDDTTPHRPSGIIKVTDRETLTIIR